ncbi:MAG: ABC transporter permease subunit [Planctomycetaceae bacterium]
MTRRSPSPSDRGGMSPDRKRSIPLLLAEIAAPLVVFLLVIGAWSLIVTAGRISPVVMPGPKLVLEAMVRIRYDLSVALARTLLAALSGLALSIVGGTIIAFVFSQAALIRRAFYPYAVLLQTVPIIAIAPIVIVLLGRGFAGIVLISCLISLFPIITSTTTGLLQIDAGHQDLFRLYRATRWQILMKLRVPTALPYLISGIRISSGTAIVGAIVGEFFVGSSIPGLGVLIQRKFAALNLPELYAVVAVSTLLGAVMFGLITLLGEAILKKWYGMSLSGRR